MARRDFSDARRFARECPLDKMVLVERRIAAIARRYLGELPGMTWTASPRRSGTLMVGDKLVATVAAASEDGWTWMVWAPGTIHRHILNSDVSGDACSLRAARAAVASVLSTNEWDDAYVPPTA